VFDRHQGGQGLVLLPLPVERCLARPRAEFGCGLLRLKGPLAILTPDGHGFPYLPYVRLLGHKKGLLSP